MYNLISRFRAFFSAKIGRCGTCMRQSLAAALAGWGFFGIALLIWPDGLARDLIGLSALALTILWIMHVAAYVARALAQVWSEDERRDMRGTALARTEPSVVNVGRRGAFAVLLRAAGVGLAVSVPVLLWPFDSFAFCGQCTKDKDCGVGFKCKNTEAVNSGKICNECVRS